MFLGVDAHARANVSRGLRRARSPAAERRVSGPPTERADRAQVDIANWNDDKTACSLILPENPLNENVELPPGKELLYSNILCGVIRGALEMILLKVDCYYVKDVLRGDETNEIRVCLLEKMQVEMADEYKES